MPSFKASDVPRITAMRQGGRALGQVKAGLVAFTTVGTTFEEIEAEAQRLIKAAGCVPSFSTVPGYRWATCIMKNDEMCHGIPVGKKVADGDIITIDVGLIKDEYHLDTTVTVVVGRSTPQKDEFLAVGRSALAKAIAKAKPGNTVYDISKALQKGVESHGFGAVYQLTGHGIGKKLHDWPSIPCVAERRDKKNALVPGMTIAIEIMYTQGAPDLQIDADGWTYRTIDGSWSGMFEETVLVTDKEPEILTQS